MIKPQKIHVCQVHIFSRYLLAQLLILALAALFFLVPVLPLSAAGDVSELKKGKVELHDIRTEIKKKKKGLARAGRREKDLLSEIKKIDIRLKELEADENRLDREIIMMEKRLMDKKSSISVFRQEMEKKRGLLSRRLMFLYKYRNTGYVAFLLAPEDRMDAGRKYRYMIRVAAYDSALIEGYKKDVAELSVQLAETQAGKKELEIAEDNLAKKRSEIERKKKERDTLLSGVRKEKLQYKESIKELNANARSLQMLLQRLEREASIASKRNLSREMESSTATGFELQKGRLDFPVRGDVVGLFGKVIDKDSKTAVFRKGVEIRVKSASEVRAVYGGKVIYADQFKGYGQMIIIDHGGGFYTLYAHTSRLIKKMNDEINKGDIIAEIGVRGTSGEPVLYFEVRRAGKPEDPMVWLKS